MPQRLAQISVADNLCQLAKEFTSGDPTMAGVIRKEFKTKSKNDVVRATVYLMEVIGSRDEQYKILQKENSDLREILKLNNIELDGEKSDKGAASSTEGSNGVAAAGVVEDTGAGTTGIVSSGEANGTAQTS